MALYIKDFETMREENLRLKDEIKKNQEERVGQQNVINEMIERHEAQLKEQYEQRQMVLSEKKLMQSSIVQFQSKITELESEIEDLSSLISQKENEIDKFENKLSNFAEIQRQRNELQIAIQEEQSSRTILND